MTRRQAALLLGVKEEAGPAEVRQAWRVWARLAHPDAGGDRGHFEALMLARDVLLVPQERVNNGAHDAARTVIPASAPAPEPKPRYPLRDVCRFPGRRGWAAIACAAVVALVSATTVIFADEWVAAFLMGLSSAVFAVVLERSVGTPLTDTGHRIALRVVAWVPMTVATVGVASTLGGSVIAVLPALVVPFIIAIAMVNPGAGLWHPVRTSD
jgi:hypothetical protein